MVWAWIATGLISGGDKSGHSYTALPCPSNVGALVGGASMAITTPTHTGTSPWTVAIHSPVGSETWQREALHAALGDVTFFVNEATKRGTAVLVTVRDKRGVLVSRSWSPAYDIFPGVH